MTIWEKLTKPENSALLWRFGVIALIPLIVLVLPTWYWGMQYELHPQSAAGMRFGIRLDKTTSETCLVFKSFKVPAELRDYLCSK